MPLRTLVVDDSSSMRGLLRELLCERNYEVTVAATAEEAATAWEIYDEMLALEDEANAGA